VVGSNTTPIPEMSISGPHLAAVAVVVRRAVRSPQPAVDVACGHLVRAGGKGFRPLVSILAAEAVGEITPRTHAAAASCELLHLSTLYHDDVIDDADRRRGATTVNRAWGERVAVLAGNRLTALALEVAGRAGGQVPAVMASTYRQLVEGERHESQLIGRTDQHITDYLRVIDGKTASLIAAAAQVGAASSGGDPAHARALQEWGRTVGQAYQIADDVLDVTATTATTGKPTAHDLRQGVFTLPLLMALTGPFGTQIRVLLAGGTPYPSRTIGRVLELLQASGAIEQACDTVDDLLGRADEHLATLPPSRARHALHELARSVMPAYRPSPATSTAPAREPELA
jgi:heptaprenyl diphosphate synthase